MKNLILTLGLFFLTNVSFAQTSATYDEVLSKQKKGVIDKYTSQNGEEYKVGDTLTIGLALRNEEFDFIVQNAGLTAYPLTNQATNSNVVIKNMKIYAKNIWVYTTKPNGHSFGLVINNFEGAIKNGEIVSNIMTSDKAIAELKKWKDKLDLGLISEMDYNKKKEELSKFIK